MKNKVYLILFFTLTTKLVVFGQTVSNAVEHLESGRFAIAEEQFKNIASRENGANEYFYLGNFYLLNSKIDLKTAKENFDIGLSIRSKNPLCSVGLLTIDLINNQNKNFNNEFNAIMDRTKKSEKAEVLFRIANAFIIGQKKDYYDYAKTIIEQALLISPDNADFLIALADIELFRYNAAASVTHLEKAITISSGYKKAKAYTRMGIIYQIARHPSNSINNYKKAIETDSNYEPAYIGLNSLYNTEWMKNPNSNQKSSVSSSSSDLLISAAIFGGLYLIFGDSMKKSFESGSSQTSSFFNRLINCSTSSGIDYFVNEPTKAAIVVEAYNSVVQKRGYSVKNVTADVLKGYLVQELNNNGNQSLANLIEGYSFVNCIFKNN